MIREVLTMARLRAMDPDEAAALWTVRLADGEHAQERDLFEEWLDLTPGNQEAWDRAQRGWSLFDRATEDELLDEMRRHARAATPAPAHRNWRQLAAAAAALLVVVSGSIVVERSGVFSNANSGRTTATGTTPVVAASYTYANGRELPKLITLPDGSRMTLDAESRVAARFSGAQRNIEVIAGRAFFDVRHDSSRPFTVHAANLRVVDIGTKFDVELARQRVRIMLIEGRLSVTAPSVTEPLLLSAGDQLTAEGSSRPVLARAVGDSSLSWQNGLASFDNMKLSDAAAVLNRYPGPALVVRDPKVRDLRVSGMFKLGDADRFGRTLEQIYPVRVVRRNEAEVEIVPAG